MAKKSNPGAKAAVEALVRRLKANVARQEVQLSESKLQLAGAESMLADLQEVKEKDDEKSGA